MQHPVDKYIELWSELCAIHKRQEARLKDVKQGGSALAVYDASVKDSNRLKTLHQEMQDTWSQIEDPDRLWLTQELVFGPSK